MQVIFDRLSKFVGFLGRLELFAFSRGSWNLQPHEAQLIQAVRAELDTGQKDILDRQLSKRFFVDRIGGDGRVNVIHFDDLDASCLYEDPAFQLLRYRVRFSSNGANHNAFIEFYEGRLFSISFKRLGRTFKGTNIDILSVNVSQSKRGIDEQLDRLEHGRT